MNKLEKFVHKLDRLQRRVKPAAFVVAVIKKYGEDQAGYKAALLTYYAFLSLFPLLLILATLVQVIPDHQDHLQQTIINDVASYVPILGSQLSKHVSTLHKNGLALIIGMLFLLYGARGVAGAFRYTVNQIWRVPLEQRDGFPKSLAKNMVIIIVGGVSLVLASISAGLISGSSRGLGLKLASLVVNAIILYLLLSFMIGLSLPRNFALKYKDNGALGATIGLIGLQVLGSYVLARVLKNLDALYSYFALALGLLFWLYLQAQVICYALVVASVKAQKLYPRNLIG